MAQSRNEAYQPSLWDRLRDDLPGLRSDIASLWERLEDLQPDLDLADLIRGGEVALKMRTDLDEMVKDLARQLVRKAKQGRDIEERGVVVSERDLRDAVRRDIEMLFNIERNEVRYLLGKTEAETVEAPASVLAEFPEVRKSVVNYGVPSFAGRMRSDFKDVGPLERELRAALQAFETRLKPDSISVKVSFPKTSGMRVDIDAILLLSPSPERLRLSTTIDMDNGRAETALEAV